MKETVAILNSRYKKSRFKRKSTGQPYLEREREKEREREVRNRQKL